MEFPILSNDMMTSFHRRRPPLILVATAVVITAAGFALSLEQRVDDAPLPFSVTSGLQGAITEIGRKGGKSVTAITFALGETKETLPQNALSIVVLQDDEGISHGAPLVAALTAGKRVFGYKYTSSNAVAERAAQALVDAGTPQLFPELFPGQFFASATARADIDFIEDFENLGITFASPEDVTLEKNSRYVFLALDGGADLTVRGLAWETVTLLPTGGGGSPLWDGGTFTSIDEGVEQGQITPNDRMQTTTVLYPQQVGNCNGSVCYPIGPPPPQATFFQLSRLPSNVQNVSTVRLRIVGDRSIGEWNNIVRARLINGVTRVPLTSYATVPAFPKVSAVGSLTEVDLIPISSVEASEWADPMLEIATNWRYCSYVTTSGSCGGNLPSTRITIFAIDALVMPVCDGACESVAPACGNNILERYANEECDDGDDEDANVCSNACAITGNWWIEELGTVGPVRLLAADERAGPVLARTPDDGVALWYDDYITNRDVYDRLFVSTFTRPQSWSEPQQLNPDGSFVTIVPRPTAENNVIQNPRFFVDAAGNTSMFFMIGNALHRADRNPATNVWSVSPYPSNTLFEVDRVGAEQTLVLLNMPLSSEASAQFFQNGLYATVLRSGVWSAPKLVLTYEETADVQARLAQVKAQAGGNIETMRQILNSTQGIPSQTAAVIGEQNGTYQIRWYGSTASFSLTAQ